MSEYVVKRPHPVFAPIWLVWTGFVFYALTQPATPAWGLWVLLAFLPIEGVAVAWKNGSRDTLSEITTWVFVHYLSKHKKPGRGWNALLLGYVLSVSWLLKRTVEYYADSRVLALVLGALTAIWLHDHWLRPDLHG